MRIRLSPRNSRVYSVNTIYDSAAEARKACAETALADGVIDFIHSWTHSEDDMDVIEETDSFSAISLQQFFDSLPKPFPEPVAGRSAADINGPAWLNTTLQSARGAKLVPNFVWIADARHNCERSPYHCYALSTDPSKSTDACSASSDRVKSGHISLRHVS